MRRSPLVGLLVLSVMGFSGCAGLSKRMDWSSPRADLPAAAEAPAQPRFSWWRRPQAEPPPTDSLAEIAGVNRALMPAPSATIPGDVWPESKSDWMVRYFPNLSRLLNGNAAGNSPEPEPVSDIVRVSPRSRPLAASHAGRADDDVRPVDASADDDIAARDRPSVTETRERFVPPVVPTPLLVRSRPQTLPETTSEVELDVTKVDPGRESQARSDELEAPDRTTGAGLSSAVDRDAGSGQCVAGRDACPGIGFLSRRPRPRPIPSLAPRSHRTPIRSRSRPKLRRRLRRRALRHRRRFRRHRR